MASPPASDDPARPSRKRKPTSTSNFGVSRRESHDSSGFYARFTPPTLDLDDEIAAPLAVDEVFCGDSRDMAQVAARSVALVVTSPPYFAGKEYEEALGEGHIPASYFEYLDMLESVFAECVRVLEPGGRIAVNVANLGRKPYRSLSADIIGILQDRLGLWLRAEIVWQKGKGANGSCAWGSYRKPSNPVLRDVTERVIVASKGRLDRAVKQPERAGLGLPSHATVSRDEFLDATLDVWELPTESARRVSHPAPFPVELPQRLIELYTYEGDLVLDPFMGSGTTAVAAVRTGRHYVGYDTDPDYVEIAQKRAAEEVNRTVAAEPVNPTGDGLEVLARAAVGQAGFRNVTTRPVKRRGGLEFAFGATDAKGREWLFDVVGGFTVPTNGLRRAELLWRTLGRAAAATAHDKDARVVVLTSSLPKRGTPGDQALNGALGSTLVDAMVPTDPEAIEELRRLAAGRRSRHRGVSRFTKLTELMTGVGMLGGPDPADLLPLPPPELVGVDPETWAAVLAQATEPEAAGVAAAALANGRAFLAASDGLRGRIPARIEWTGPHRDPGDEVAPVDLRVDHVYLVSCKYLSAITVNASPHHLFDRLLTGGHGHRGGDWFDEVAPVEHRSLFRAAVGTLGMSTAVTSPVELPRDVRRAIAKELTGRAWPQELQGAYDALVAAVSQASARRWLDAIARAGSAESMLWRLLRIGSAPYFVLGAQRDAVVRLRVGSPWDWRQSFRFRRFDIVAPTTGQPRVDWCGSYVERASGTEAEVAGHVEIRWSHGRFSGPPEAKVYLDTPHRDVPGYFPLR